MRKKTGNALLALAAAALVLTVNVGSAGAYFTTYVEAQGGAVVHLGDETDIREEVSGWVKHLQVENKEGSAPVYVRARAFCGSQYELVYAGNDWLAVEDGFYLYKGIVEGGETTTELTIEIVNAKEKENSFDVTVIYESIPIQNDEDGNILNPVVKTESGEIANPAVDWNKKLDVIESKPAGEMTDTPDTNPDESSGSGQGTTPETGESQDQGQSPGGTQDQTPESDGSQDQTPETGESQDQTSESGGSSDQTGESGQSSSGTGQESGEAQDAEPNGGEG